MNKVILIMGHLASGKTTFAKHLARDMNLLYFCKDDIKEILVDELGYKDREENQRLSKATFRMMSHTIANLNDQGILLLESNFKYHELDILRLKHLQTSFLTIFLTGQVDILYQRYLNRQEHRHIAHKSTGDIPYDVFKASMFEYLPENTLGETYLFDTSNEDKVYDSIKKIITDFITNK